MDDLNIDNMTVNELREFKANIELAIRAAIRARKMPKVMSNPATTAPAKFIDLASERDAWMARRK